MKKIIFVLLGVLIAFSLWAETIVITESCQIRDTEDYKTSKKIGVAIKDEVYQTLGKHGDWYKIEVIDIKTSKKYQGWIWSGAITIENKDISVIGQGATLRSEHKKGDNVIGYIFPESIGKIIKEKITWYKINRQGVVGWVSTICCKTK